MTRAWLARRAKALSARLLRRAPREFFIVAACCRWPASEARDAIVGAASSGDVDWPLALRIIARHRVWGRARASLAQASVTPPAPFEANLAASVFSMTRRNLALASETAGLCEAFQKARIDALFVKGATLEAMIYGDFTLKHSLDIDILVSSQMVEEARALLEQRGYALFPPLPSMKKAQLELLIASSREWEFRHRANGLVVELHWRLAYNECLIAGLDLSSPRQGAMVGGVFVPTLRREELFVYLCVHGAQHSWSRLKWLADVVALLAHDGADIERLYRAAETAGAARCAGQMLLLCETLLGLELPVSLSQRLHGSVAAALLEALALEAMLAGGAATEPHRGPRRQISVFFTLLLLGQGENFLAREITRYMIAPADVAAFPLPPRLAWLYIALRAPLWALRLFRRLTRRTSQPR